MSTVCRVFLHLPAHWTFFSVTYCVQVQPKESITGVWNCALQARGEPAVLHAVFQNRLQRVEGGRCEYLQQLVEFLLLDHESVNILCFHLHRTLFDRGLHQCIKTTFSRASLNNYIYVSFPLKLNFDLDRGVFPMVIQAVVDEGDGRLLELHNSQDKMYFLLRLALAVELSTNTHLGQH